MDVILTPPAVVVGRLLGDMVCFRIVARLCIMGLR